MNKRISVAIPHYNNARYMRDTLNPLIGDDRVGEIVIVDDQSNDWGELKDLTTSIQSSKIKLHQNAENLGVYNNKLQTVSQCSNEWTILLDADNIADAEYINTLYKLEDWRSDTIYHPMWGRTFRTDTPEEPSPNLNFKNFSGQCITPEAYIKNFKNVIFQCLINSCNYFVPTRNYTNCMAQGRKIYSRNQINSLDSATLFTDWLCAGNKVYVVDGLVHHHRLHSQSNYVIHCNAELESQVKEWLLQKVKSLRL